MSVNVCLPLFGTPSHELETEDIVSAKQLRELADNLGERLRKAADLLEKLKADGWTAHLALYDVILSRVGVETREQAEQLLQASGIEPSELMIIEEVEEDE